MLKKRTSLPRVIVAALLAAGLLAAIPTGVFAATEALPTAITSQEAAQQLLDQAAQRFEDRWGVTIDKSRYEVLEVPDSVAGVAYFVMPLDTMTLYYQSAAVGGCDPSQGEPCTPQPIQMPKRVELPAGDTTAVVDATSYTVGFFGLPTGAGASPTKDPVSLPPIRTYAQADEAQGDAELGASWRPAGDECWARVENGTGWFDACYQFAQWTNDGSSSKDIWALTLFGTCKGKGTHSLEICQLASKGNPNVPTNNPTDWVDWGPRSDQDVGGCIAVDVKAAYKGVGVGVRANICEKWDISKYAEPGKFDNVWRGEKRRTERDVAYSTIFKTDEGMPPHMVGRIHFSTNGYQTVDWG